MTEAGEAPSQNASEIQKKAEQGDAEAQYNLGSFYYRNYKYTEAEKWFRMAAEQGNAMAQYHLAEICEWFLDPKRPAEADKWYLKAVEQGGAEMVEQIRNKQYKSDCEQYILGFIYKNGIVVPQDNDEAAKWFRMAAEEGHAMAQYNLGVMYEIGENVPLNYKMAYVWYNISAANPSGRGEDRKKAAKARDNIAKRLSATGLEHAQDIANEMWIKKKWWK